MFVRSCVPKSNEKAQLSGMDFANRSRLPSPKRPSKDMASSKDSKNARCSHFSEATNFHDDQDGFKMPQSSESRLDLANRSRLSSPKRPSKDITRFGESKKAKLMHFPGGNSFYGNQDAFKIPQLPEFTLGCKQLTFLQKKTRVTGVVQPMRCSDEVQETEVVSESPWQNFNFEFNDEK